MSRVLVAGGVGTIGSAVVRRLLADPAYEVRVADRKDAPQWMREACEIRIADLSDVEQASSAIDGCAYVIHLANAAAAAAQGLDFSVLATSAALDSALLSAAAGHEVERFIYVSCAATLQPEGEPEPDRSGPLDRPTASSASGFAKLLGERLCRAAEVEHGLSFAICRVSSSPPEAIEEIAAEIVGAISSPTD